MRCRVCVLRLFVVLDDPETLSPGPPLTAQLAFDFAPAVVPAINADAAHFETVIARALEQADMRVRGYVFSPITRRYEKETNTR